MREVCPMHTEEDPQEGISVPESGGWAFTCPITTGHAYPGSYSWERTQPPPDLPEIGELAIELGLDIALPEIVSEFGTTWVEYGVVEQAFAAQHPDAFEFLVKRYGHTAIASTTYSSSAFIGATLNRLAAHGEFEVRRERATGRWSYNQDVTWCAASPSGDWSNRISWASRDADMFYVPGCTEEKS